VLRLLFISIVTLALAACGDGGSGGESDDPGTPDVGPDTVDTISVDVDAATDGGGPVLDTGNPDVPMVEDTSLDLAEISGPDDTFTAEVGEPVDVPGPDLPEKPLPELPSGPDDLYSAAGCALQDGATAPLIAVENPSDAGQVLLLPTPDNAYRIQLPESGHGYVTLEIPDWKVIIALFTGYETQITVHDPEAKTEPILELSWAASCPDALITDERKKYHKWGPFMLELQGEQGAEIWLSAILME
jgi:hypothetical protein